MHKIAAVLCIKNTKKSIFKKKIEKSWLKIGQEGGLASLGTPVNSFFDFLQENRDFFIFHENTHFFLILSFFGDF